jgi:hypothetical protein
MQHYVVQTYDRTEDEVCICASSLPIAIYIRKCEQTALKATVFTTQEPVHFDPEAGDNMYV